LGLGGCLWRVWDIFQREEKSPIREQIQVLSKSGKFAEAVPLAEKHLAETIEKWGEDSLFVIPSLKDLAKLYYNLGDCKKAAPLYERCLRTYERVHAPENLDIAAALNNLALLYQGMGDHKRAEPLFERSLKITKKALGPEHPDTANSLNGLAGLYSKMGDYGRAEPLYERSLKITEKALGPVHPDTANSLNGLAELYRNMHDYGKAEPLYERSLKIYEKVLGSEHQHTATALNNLALLYQGMGDYRKAEPLYERSLKIMEKVLGPEHPYTASSLNNLAELYRNMHDYRKAEPLYERSLKIMEKVLGPEHPDMALLLNNLALLYQTVGDYKKAEPLYERSLKITEKALGSEHPFMARILNNLALLYKSMGYYKIAEPLYERSLMIYEKVLGPDHPDMALSLNNLAVLYKDTGDYMKAEPLFERSLKITEKALGPVHPDTGTCFGNMAFFQYFKDGKAYEEWVRKWAKTEKAIWEDVFSFTSERQRMAFQSSRDPFSLPMSLGMVPESVDALLRYKGIVLDSMMEDNRLGRSSRNPEVEKLVDAGRFAVAKLNKVEQEAEKTQSDEERRKHRKEIETVRAEVEGIQKELARKVVGHGKSRRSLGIVPADVQENLAPQEVLLEFIRYSHSYKEGGKEKSENRYGVSLIPAKGIALKGKKAGEVGFVTAGKAEEIEVAMVCYKRPLKEKNGNLEEEDLKNLYDLVLGKVLAQLPEGVKSLVVSPDSELNFLNFGALVDGKGKFLNERYRVKYVSSGRDLVGDKGGTEQKEAKAGGDQLSVFANPAFEAKQVVALTSGTRGMRSMDMGDMRSLKLDPLPGTEREADYLKSQSGKWKLAVETRLGSEATEEEVNNVKSPKILHLATHGFFLPDIARREEAGRMEGPGKEPVMLRNPLHRSGLAFAGAKATFDAWDRGERPPTESDGILTAGEAGCLDLRGTWMVVLSACDTGSGEARNGEGVLGLRRGFVAAGAENLVMSLWPVDDKETAAMMEAFYARAVETGNAPEAMDDIQREWLKKLRAEKKSIGKAVKLAAPFVVSYQKIAE